MNASLSALKVFFNAAEPAAMPSARSPFDAVTSVASASPSKPNGHALPPGWPGDVAMGDWDDLLSAVKSRLRLSVEELRALASVGAAARAHTGVLECVAALDQLHTTLAHELGRRQQLEMEVFDAHTALAQARAELAGMQAGERRARHLALHDTLTALPNRSFFRDRLAAALVEALAQRQGLAVLYLDLDGFKPINDAHGHAAGDELLRIVAARLTRSVRAGDMVSRLGGDEFAVLVASTLSRPQLSQLACKLFDAVSAPLMIGKLRLAVRPSIGVATCPDDGTTVEGLLARADGAMYHAKRNHCGYAFCDRAGQG